MSNSHLTNVNTPGRATANNVLTKLRSLTNTVAESAEQGADVISDSIEEVSSKTVEASEAVASKISSQSAYDNFWMVMRYGFAIVLIILLVIKFYQPVIDFLGRSLESTTRQTIGTGVAGTSALAKTISSTIGAIGNLENIGSSGKGSGKGNGKGSGTGNGKGNGKGNDNSNDDDDSDDDDANNTVTSVNNTNNQKSISADKSTIIKALDESRQTKSANNIPLPDDSVSRTQLANTSNKSGYCYIGEDRGFRSCIQVGSGDKCISGDIFPSMDICINPSLRQ